jgi:hypothetical protein
MTSRGLAIVLALSLEVVGACATHKAAWPRFEEADLSVPHLADEVCGGQDSAAEIRVRVVDSTGARLPQVPVFLVPFSHGRPGQTIGERGLGVFTDSSGEAVLRGTGGISRYVVLAAMAAFLPEVRVFEIPQGCSGSLSIRLRVATREELDGLNAGRTAE